jgi:hypothetical protein
VIVATDGITGMTTYQLTYSLDASQANVYAMAGTADTTMAFPPAFQVATPFGADIGGVARAFFALNADSEFDSWLTVGVTDGTAGTALSASPGLGLDAWSASTGYTTDNGAIFWMDPAQGASTSTSAYTTRGH